MTILFLHEFLTLAKYLNFSKSARALNITQPTLSRHILQLETELGVQLFIRDSQSVRLTEAGRFFVQEAEKIVECYDNAARRMSCFKEGLHGSITIAYRRLYGESPWLNILHGFKEQYPTIRSTFISLTDFDIIYSKLVKNEVDVIVMASIDEFFGNNDFDLLKLESSTLCAVMSTAHPLASRREIYFTDLIDTPIILPDGQNHLSFPDKILRMFEEHGLKPRTIYTAKYIDDADLWIELNQAVNLIPKCYYNKQSNAGFCCIEMPETRNLFDVFIVKKKQNKNATMRLFHRLCKEEINKFNSDVQESG